MEPERDLDLIVFGASGFTGAYVCEFVAAAFVAENPCDAISQYMERYTLPESRARVVSRNKQVSLSRRGDGRPRRVGFAGRSLPRIAEIRSQVCAKTGVSEESIELLTADTGDLASLAAVTARTRVFINCVGPYRFHGEPVIQACIQTRTACVDLSGEPQFLEDMELKYHDDAVETGTLIVSSCGFDSIPADVGTAWLERQFSARGATATIVDSYVALASSGPQGVTGHFTTYECAVHGFGSVSRLHAIRKAMHTKYAALAAALQPVGLRRPRREGVSWESSLHAWALPFPGADASVVRRTQRQLPMLSLRSDTPRHVPVQYGAYFLVHSTVYMLLFIAFGALLTIFARFRWGRQLLLRFPSLFTFGAFSHEGPSIQQLRATSFNMTFRGQGYSETAMKQIGSGISTTPDVHLAAVLAGPEPGYVATAAMVAAAAMTILEDRNSMPPGGVWTPGTAFRATRLVERLEAGGVEISVKRVASAAI